jgi:hypothetical protein
MGQTVWITWTKYGVAQPAVGAQWKYNNLMGSYWQTNLGQFVRGDSVEYFVDANENQANEQVVHSLSFNITSWCAATYVIGCTDNGTSVDIRFGNSDGSLALAHFL